MPARLDFGRDALDVGAQDAGHGGAEHRHERQGAPHLADIGAHALDQGTVAAEHGLGAAQVRAEAQARALPPAGFVVEHVVVGAAARVAEHRHAVEVVEARRHAGVVAGIGDHPARELIHGCLLCGTRARFFP